MRIWYLCYHSTKYPAVKFVQLDNIDNHESMRITNFEEPDANSTLLNPDLYSHTEAHERIVSSTSSLPGSTTHAVRQNVSVHTEWPDEHSSYDVGHISHIPRKPPTPTTYTIPSVNKSITTVTEHSHKEDLFGMIKLKDNDVCYTSGSIEWVGRKRSYPINSGFKIINKSLGDETTTKRVKRLDKTFTFHADMTKDCECADVLPTVNAIVDHLNALHEAVDLVDLRLNTLEGVVERNE